MLFHTQLLVIIQHAIVGKGKVHIGMTVKRVVVVVEILVALSSHSRMSHNGSCAVRCVESQFMSWFRSLVDSDFAVFHIGNAGRICSSFFRRIRQSLCQLFQQPVRHNTLVIQPTK